MDDASAAPADRPESDSSGPAVGPQVIFAMDLDGTCTLSTGPGLSKLGVEPGQLVGANLFEVYRDDVDALQSLGRVVAGESFTTETPFHGRILSVFYQPVHDADGKLTGALGVSTDVTDQRRVEAEVRAARERASMLADLSSELSREVIDLDTILQVAVRFATEAVGDVGVIWLHDVLDNVLEPRATWGFPPDLQAYWEENKTTRELDSYLTATGARGAPQVVDLHAEGVDRGRHGEMSARLARALAVHTDLRIPLRSRGVLVGAVDVLRGGDSPRFDEDDETLAMEVAERCALAIDNARLLETRRVAREELLKFKALADASTNLIAIIDDDGRALYVNPQVYALGIEPVHDDVWSTVGEQLGDETLTVIQDALATRGQWSGEITLSVTGGTAAARAEVFALHHPDTGASLGHAWIVQVTTELKATEAALREAVSDLKKFKALVEASPDFIAIADLDGTVRYVNPHGRELVGMAPDLDVTSTEIADYLTSDGLKLSVEVEQPAVVEHGHFEGASTLRDWRGGAPIPVAIASFLMRDVETGEPFALATVQRDVTERLAAETALRDLADQRQALLNRLVDAQDAERTRIAADVHDDPVQALAAVDLRLGLLRRQVRDRAPELLEALDPLQRSVTGATDRLRALLFDLEPPDLQHGLTDALRRAADEIFESTAVRWSVTSDQEPAATDATRAVAYRVVREALINVRKHAQAEHVEVHVGSRDGGIAIEVSDDGVGLGRDAALAAPGHRGLLTMQDRAAAAGGRCAVHERPPSGTLVTLWLPTT